jgi:hypothetical protein
MKMFAVAAGLAAASLAWCAPAVAAPVGDSAAETIAMLEADGANRVIIHRLSDLPLSEAQVVAVQPGPDLRGRVWDSDHDNTYQWVMTGMVYYVTVR